MTKPPHRDLWISGLPLGNGDVGVMAWGDGGPLKLTLDKSDLWDTRMQWPQEPDFNYATMRRCAREGRWEDFQWLFEESIRQANSLGPTKISFGRLELSLGDRIDGHSGQLSFYRGVAELRVTAAGAEYAVTAFVHRDLNLLCVHVEPAPEPLRVRLLALSEINPVLAELDSYSPRAVPTEGSGGALTQQVPEGVGCAAAWHADADGTLMLALESAQDAEGALAAARATLAGARERGWDDLLA